MDLVKDEDKELPEKNHNAADVNLSHIETLQH